MCVPIIFLNFPLKKRVVQCVIINCKIKYYPSFSVIQRTLPNSRMLYPLFRVYKQFWICIIPFKLAIICCLIIIKSQTASLGEGGVLSFLPVVVLSIDSGYYYVPTLKLYLLQYCVLKMFHYYKFIKNKNIHYCVFLKCHINLIQIFCNCHISILFLKIQKLS